MAITLAHAGQTTIDLLGGVYIIDWGQGGGPDLSQAQTTWEEVPTYAGSANTQVNVSVRKALVPVTIPMAVAGTSVADLKAKLDVLWATVDACTTASPGTLTWETESYSIVYSSRPESILRDPVYQLRYRARFILTLMRLP